MQSPPRLILSQTPGSQKMHPSVRTHGGLIDDGPCIRCCLWETVLFGEDTVVGLACMVL